MEAIETGGFRWERCMALGTVFVHWLYVSSSCLPGSVFGRKQFLLWDLSPAVAQLSLCHIGPQADGPWPLYDHRQHELPLLLAATVPIRSDLWLRLCLSSCRCPLTLKLWHSRCPKPTSCPAPLQAWSPTTSSRTSSSKSATTTEKSTSGTSSARENARQRRRSSSAQRSVPSRRPQCRARPLLKDLSV